jgi:hypothetical protein
MNLKRKFAILSVPAILAVGGGALAVHAASTPTPSPAKSQPATDAETPDAAEAAGAAEPAGAAETADPAGAAGGGHADPAGEVDHQATGNE